MYKKELLLLAVITLSLAACNSQHSANTKNAAPTQIIVDNQRLVLPTIQHGIKPVWLSPQPPQQAEYHALSAQGHSADEAASKAYRAAIQLMRPVANEHQGFDGSIRISHLWQNPQQPTQFHALAIIEREAAYRYLRGKLDSFDAATELNVDALNNARDPITRIGLLNTMIERQQRRAAYQKSLKKIDITKEGRESPWDTRRWSLQLGQLLDGLLITPQIDAEPETKVELITNLTQGIANTGLRRARPFEADYVLSGQLETREKNLQNGYVQASATLSLSLKDIAKQKHYGHKDWHLEATALTPEDAKARLLNKMQHILKQNHRHTIIDIASQL